MLEYSKLSYWEKDLFINDLDVIIVGGGIVGYSAAISLKEKYPTLKILILERGYLPTGASTKNAGFACFGSPSELLDDLRNMSESEVTALIKKRYDGLQILRRRCGDENIDLQISGSHELFTDSKKDKELFESVKEKLRHLNEIVEQATGIKENFSLSKADFGFKNVNGLIFSKGEGQLHPGKMMRRLHEIAVAQGISIFFGSEVQNWSVNTNDEIEVATSHGTLKTSKLILATNGFSKAIWPDAELNPARGQVLVTEPLENIKFEGTFHYDAGYVYFRNIGKRILIGGARNLDLEGETTTDFKNSEIITGSLKNLLYEVLCPDSKPKIAYSWAGIMGVGNVRMPIIQEVEKNVFAGVRLGGMGVALGSLVGEKLAEMIEPNQRK
ncbi:MAG: FAD-dependent oxidoreductase [Brumimicrobium sp.]|nr:FAD-dependent oxidoreductase [Brumimicrobium sp.]